MTDRYEKIRKALAMRPTPRLNSRREGVMRLKPKPLNAEKCSYSCPYFMNGATMSRCRLTNEPLIYDGSIPPKRTERCKQESSND